MGIDGFARTPGIGEHILYQSGSPIEPQPLRSCQCQLADRWAAAVGGSKGDKMMTAENCLRHGEG